MSALARDSDASGRCPVREGDRYVEHATDAVLTVVADVTESYERRHRLAGAATRVADALAELETGDPDYDHLESVLEDARAYAVGNCGSLGGSD